MVTLLLLGACGGGGGDAPAGSTPPPAVAPAPSTVASAAATRSAQPLISLSSDAGDYIGQGMTYAYDTSNAGIRLTARGAQIDLQITGREHWTATFQLPGTLSQLERGTYTALSRYPFQSVGAGALSWSGQGRGCNTLSGSLVIDSVSYQAGRLQAIDMSFEQRCEGAAPALRGRIRIDAAAMASVAPLQNGLPAQPVVSLASEAGDYIGGGDQYAYDHATASVVVRAEGGRLRVQVDGDENWWGEFQMPGGALALAPGTYSQLTRYPFQPAGAGGLSWAGEGRGCNELTGTATIHAVRYDAAGVLAALDMEFTQHCEGGPAALRGRINWDASLAVPAPGPAATAPAGLWAPPADAMPATGNAMYITSDWGDYIGAGYTFWVGGGTLPADAPADLKGNVTVTMSETAGLFKLAVAGTANWTAEFKAMDGLARLQPGYYGIVQRYPFHNPTRGGMSFSMDSRGCNRLSGWFMVDSVEYQDGRLASIDMRFAQYCESGLSALRGRIRWRTGTTTS